MNIRSLVVVAALVALSAPFTFASSGGKSLPADKALKMLIDGNRKFVAGDLSGIAKHSNKGARAQLAKGQHPFAIIVACSDSRVAPEVLFDKGLGEIFVIRVAGNVVAPHQLASIEYAIEHLGAKLVMVLGHERCGAVTAAVDNPSGLTASLKNLVATIRPAVERAKQAAPGASRAQLVEAAADENVRLVIEAIRQSPVVHELEGKKDVSLVAAKYDFDDGMVSIFK